MAFSARVLLQRPGQSKAEYRGEIDFDLPPVQDGRIRFTYNGKIEVGRVDAVDPPDWDRLGVIPHHSRRPEPDRNEEK